MEEEMNDPRIEALIARLRKELEGTMPGELISERIEEILGHLEQAIEEFRSVGAQDPVGAALNQFGASEAYGRAVKAAGGGILLRRNNREVIMWTAALLLVPMAGDLCMDFSSWFTGSDSGLYAIGIPACLFLLWKFARASMRCRKFLGLQITALVAGSFALFAGLGGFSRAVGDYRMTQSRGTAVRRLAGLQREELPRKQRVLSMLEEAFAEFNNAAPTAAVGPYRVAGGYLVPEIPDQWAQMWKGDPRAGRWLIDGLRLSPVPTYDQAHDRWVQDGQKFVALGKSGVEGEQTEIASLQKTVASTWRESVLADLPQKESMAEFVLVWMLLVHAGGLGVGYANRRWRGPTQRTA
jgi:hypothetical protein